MTYFFEPLKTYIYLFSEQKVTGPSRFEAGKRTMQKQTYFIQNPFKNFIQIDLILLMSTLLFSVASVASFHKVTSIALHLTDKDINIKSTM